MNSFGCIFRISIFGESHGPAVGVTIDGVPPGIALAPKDFLSDLNRRKAGAKGTTPRTHKPRLEVEFRFQSKTLSKRFILLNNTFK